MADDLDMELGSNPDEEVATNTKSRSPQGIKIDASDLEDFLEEMSHAAATIQAARNDLEAIEKKSDVLKKLEKISSLDLEMIKVDVNDQVARALDVAIEPIVKEYRDGSRRLEEELRETIGGLAEEYVTTNERLKTLIFDLENARPPEKKTRSSKWVVGVLLVSALATSGYYFKDFAREAFHQITGKSVETVQISFILPARAIRVTTGEVVPIQKNYKLPARKNGEFYHFSASGNEYKIHSAFVRLEGGGL